MLGYASSLYLLAKLLGCVDLRFDGFVKLI